MESKQHPRPPSTTAAGYFLVVMAFYGFYRGLLLMNAYLHVEPLQETLPYIFPAPLLAGFCTWFIFKGHNWARILFWVTVGPLAVTGLIVRADSLNAFYTFTYVLAGGLLATRNSHWFFTGRDYRRRPIARSVPARPEPPSGGKRERRKFEY